MKYAYLSRHRDRHRTRTLWRMLDLHPGGFYAWLKTAMSKRAQEDVRQTALIGKAWEESGKVYGYRKLHDDLPGPVGKRGLVMARPDRGSARNEEGAWWGPETGE